VRDTLIVYVGVSYSCVSCGLRTKPFDNESMKDLEYGLGYCATTRVVEVEVDGDPVEVHK
jgi:hypothetical protein